MPKKQVKKTSANKKCNDCKTMAWINVVLSVILLCGAGFSIWKILSLESQVPSNIEAAKLEIVDDVLESYFNEFDLVEGGSINQVTGYGISDEDGVFYVTFDFIRHDDFPDDAKETSDLSSVPIRHGIMYFWPSEHGGFSHAYSYHDDDYRPGGEYVRLENISMAELLGQ